MKVFGVIGLICGLSIGALYVGGVIGLPDAGLESNAWGDVTDEEIEVVTTIWVDNPLFDITADELGLAYSLSMNGIGLADGNKSDIQIPEGNETTTLRTALNHQQLPAWWASHVQTDESSEMTVDTTAHVTIAGLSTSPSTTYSDTVETDLEGMIQQSLAEHEGEHTYDPIEVGSGVGTETVAPTIIVTDTDAHFERVTESETELHATVEIQNPNAYPLPRPALSGDLQLNEIELAQWNADETEVLNLGDDAVIPPGSSRDVTFVVIMDNQDVVDWFGTHVDADEYSTSTVTTQLAVSINGETLTIPAEEHALRCHGEMQTAIFVDQDQGYTHDQCELFHWDVSTDELADAGASIDLTTTDWWSDPVDADPVDSEPVDTEPGDSDDASDSADDSDESSDSDSTDEVPSDDEVIDEEIPDEDELVSSI